VLAFLQDYQQRFNRTQVFCKRLQELDLLKPMEAQFRLPSGERQSLSGFQTVDREKLKAISNEDLGKMMRTDELECIFLHLASLRHFGSIAERFSLDGDLVQAAFNASQAAQDIEDKAEEAVADVGDKGGNESVMQNSTKTDA